MINKLNTTCIFVILCSYSCCSDVLESSYRKSWVSGGPEVSVSLGKAGLHREFNIQLNFLTNDYNSGTVLLELEIPSGMYVDPYELDKCSSIQFFLSSDVNIELPEYRSSPNIMYAYIPVKNGEAHESFPLHVRYHMPHKCNEKGFSLNKEDLRVPKIYIKMDKHSDNKEDFQSFKCSPKSEVNCTWLLVRESQVSSLDYDVPVGCVEHLWIVLVGTAVTLVSGFGYMAYLVFGHRTRS